MSVVPPIPLPAASALLRRLGLSLVEAVARRTSPPALARLIGRNEVDLLLPFAGIGGAVPLTPHTLRPWLRQILWYGARGLAPTWAPPILVGDLQRAANAALHSGANARTWGRIARAWIERAVGGVSPRWVAVPFWAAAGELAWGDAAFQAEVAHLLIDELRRRVIFTPGAPPRPLIATRTFWALIALAELGRPAPWRLLLRRRAAVHGLRRLKSHAAVTALAPGWAEVWDQWLLIEAVRLWRLDDKAVAPELRAAIAELPLHAELGQGGVTPPEPPPVALAAVGWEVQLQPWIVTLAQWDREPRGEQVPA